LSFSEQVQIGKNEPLPVGKIVSSGSTQIQLISAEPPVLQLQIKGETWLLLGKIQKGMGKSLEEKLPTTPQVLLWSGKSLNKDWLEVVKPKVAIASSTTVKENIQQQLQQKQIQLYLTGRDGAIQWTPQDGFQKTLDVVDDDAF
ncbi:MAG: competence protein, partial [Moorea sp. SIO2B7]|nr:competence protein [Moorena sp. SIO2B7]